MDHAVRIHAVLVMKMRFRELHFVARSPRHQIFVQMDNYSVLQPKLGCFIFGGVLFFSSIIARNNLISFFIFLTSESETAL